MRRSFRYLVLMAGFVLANCLAPSTPAFATANGCVNSTFVAPVFPTYLPLTTNSATGVDDHSTPGSLTLAQCTPAQKTGNMHIMYTGATPTACMTVIICISYIIYVPGVPFGTPWTPSNDQTIGPTSNGTPPVSATFTASIPRGQTVPNGLYTDCMTQLVVTYPDNFQNPNVTTFNFCVQIQVGMQCAFDSSTSPTLDFGLYDPVLTNAVSDKTATWTAVYTCATNDSTYKWSFASGNALGTQMRMQSGGATFLNYYIHDSTGTNFPSGGAAQTAASEPIGNGTTLLNYNFTFGIPAGQNVAAASFSDSNVATITP